MSSYSKGKVKSSSYFYWLKQYMINRLKRLNVDCGNNHYVCIYISVIVDVCLFVQGKSFPLIIYRRGIQLVLRKACYYLIFITSYAVHVFISSSLVGSVLVIMSTFSY